MKKLELKLIKTDAGITAANETNDTIDYFDESEEARQRFVQYMVDFINTEVGGKKYQ